MNEHVVSDWEKVSAISSLVQTGAVIVSLGFIAYQIWKQTKLAKASNMQSLAELLAPLNLKLAEDGEMTRLWLGPKPEWDTAKVPVEDVAEYRYNRLLATFLIFYENAHAQHEMGLLHQDVFHAWDKDLEGFLEGIDPKYFDEYWTEHRSVYRSSFQRMVDRKIEALKSRLPPPDS